MYKVPDRLINNYKITFNQMKNLDFLKKYYLWIVVVTLSLGVISDLYTNYLIPEHKLYTFYNETGKQTKEFFTYTYQYQLLKFASNIFYTFSISLFISLFIIKKFEDKGNDLFEQKIIELQRGINKDVFEGVFNKIIDNELFELLKRDIFNRNIIRKNAEWIYDIRECTSGYTLTQTIVYELHNITDSIQEEKIILNFTPDNKSITKIKSFVCRKGETVIKECKKIEELITTTTQIFDISIQPKNYVDVTLVIENEYSKFEILDTHNSKYPIIGLKIQVNYPDNCVFELRPSFATELSIKSNENNKILYDPIKAILPGQGVTYKINKKNV